MMAKSEGNRHGRHCLSGQADGGLREMGWTVNSKHESNEVWVPDSAHADSPWSKLEVREAAEYAIDRATIAERFGYGYLDSAQSDPAADTTAYQPNYSHARNYDPAKAKQLLTQAGYRKASRPPLSNGQGLTNKSRSWKRHISRR